MRIAVLGATGTIGRALVPLLAKEYEVVAISRRPQEQSNGVRWAQADASDEASVQKAFEGIDVAYYLVHSLGSPDFAERDRLAASVVARVAEREGLRQLVYLGGLGDESPELSRHLRSRAETAAMLACGLRARDDGPRSDGDRRRERRVRDDRRARRPLARDDLPALGLDADAADRTRGRRPHTWLRPRATIRCSVSRSTRADRTS